MEQKLKQIKYQARNADKSDLRGVIENLAEAVLELHKIFNAKSITKEKVIKKPIRKSTKAKPKTLKNM